MSIIHCAVCCYNSSTGDENRVAEVYWQGNIVWFRQSAICQGRRAWLWNMLACLIGCAMNLTPLWSLWRVKTIYIMGEALIYKCHVITAVNLNRDLINHHYWFREIQLFLGSCSFSVLLKPPTNTLTNRNTHNVLVTNSSKFTSYRLLEVSVSYCFEICMRLWHRINSYMCLRTSQNVNFSSRKLWMIIIIPLHRKHSIAILLSVFKFEGNLWCIKLTCHRFPPKWNVNRLVCRTLYWQSKRGRS